MAVLGWMAIGLVTAVLGSGLRRGDEDRAVLVGRYTTGIVGGLVGGLVAAVAGLGAIDEFFHSGTWLMALSGAVVALFVYELVGGPHERQEAPGGWPGSTDAGESERHDRNW